MIIPWLSAAGVCAGAVRDESRAAPAHVTTARSTGTAEEFIGSRPAELTTARPRVASTSKDVEDTLPPPQLSTANLDAHTGDGGIQLDLPVQVSGRFSRGTVVGALNGGARRSCSGAATAASGSGRASRF